MSKPNQGVLTKKIGGVWHAWFALDSGRYHANNKNKAAAISEVRRLVNRDRHGADRNLAIMTRLVKKGTKHRHPVLNAWQEQYDALAIAGALVLLPKLAVDSRGE
jgi:hypothetical protein